MKARRRQAKIGAAMLAASVAYAAAHALGIDFGDGYVLALTLLGLTRWLP